MKLSDGAPLARWQPCFTLDLAEQGLLPPDALAAVAALADAPERMTIIAEPDWSFEIVTGDVLRDRLDWFWTLYHGALRDFASDSFGVPLFAGNRLSAAMTLNILRGTGATNDWHRDANPVTGVLYAGGGAAGGDLMLRDAAGREARLRPKPGLFVCFEGAIDHQVEPLADDGVRLALAMVYYRSPTDQPPAYGADIYGIESQPSGPT